MTDIAIIDAKRTPIGGLGGGLSTLSAAQLGSHIISHLLETHKIDPAEVDEVIMGNVLTAAAGMNPARQAAIGASIPQDKTALTINQVCGSGLRAVALGMQSILCGDANMVIAGGQESMSQSPHAIHLRTPTKMGNATMIDTMINDGLWDCFNNYHMGTTAENIAERFGISREEQDAFAASSQQKASAAQQADTFQDEIAPVTVKHRKGEDVVSKDEHPREGTTAEGLAKLKPAFSKDGTVTAGNASGINDGAAAVILMRADDTSQRGLTPLAIIKSWATRGVDPQIMGTGPVPASRAALEKAGWSAGDLDMVEANEAFAAQAIYVNREMGWDESKVNVNGGAIALGHPIGASGARVLTTLLHEMNRSGGKKGLATLCIGGGMGIAMCVERD